MRFAHKPLLFLSGIIYPSDNVMNASKVPATPSAGLFEIISKSPNIRQHFGKWLKEFFKDSISIKDFEALHESIKIGIVYNYITKLNINITVYKRAYDIYFLENTDEEFENLNSMSMMNIVELYNMDYYIERAKKYNGNIMQGLKLAIVDTLTFLNNSKWLMN